MIEVMKQAFAAGETKSFMIPAERIELLEVPYTVDVALLDRNGVQLSSMLAAEASYFLQPRNGPFSEFRITSPVAQTVRWFVGSGDAGTRKTSGVVTVVDDNRSLVYASKSYVASVGLGATAGQYSLLQLWNPPGSGVNLEVDRIKLSASPAAAAYVYVAADSVALASAVNPGSLMVGGGAGNAQARYASPAALPGTLATVYDQHALPAGANQSAASDFKRPIVVPPGSGLTVYVSTNNTAVNALMYYVERAI